MNCLKTQLSEFSEHEMNNPLALCELAARTPNISAGHKIKQAWLQNDRVFILAFEGSDRRSEPLDDDGSVLDTIWKLCHRLPVFQHTTADTHIFLETGL